MGFSRQEYWSGVPLPSPYTGILPNIKKNSLVAQRLKRLPLLRETWVRSLGREDPLEEGVETHSGILAWEISWTEELRATVHGVTKSQT